MWSVESGSSGYGIRPAAALQLSQMSSCYRKAVFVRTCSPPPGTRYRARLACLQASSRRPHQWCLDRRRHSRLAYHVCRCRRRLNWARPPRNRRRLPRPPPRPCHHLLRWRRRAHHTQTGLDRPRPRTQHARCQRPPRRGSARGRLLPRREAGVEWWERCRPPPAALARGRYACRTRRHARCELRGTWSSRPRCVPCACRASCSPLAACWSTLWPGSSSSRPTRGTSAGRSGC
jgi:hypothetical protein